MIMMMMARGNDVSPALFGVRGSSGVNSGALYVLPADFKSDGCFDHQRDLCSVSLSLFREVERWSLGTE